MPSLSHRVSLWMAALSFGTAATLALASSQQGGIVATEFRPDLVTAGPEADVTFFATGETIGKIEPCG